MTNENAGATKHGKRETGNGTITFVQALYTAAWMVTIIYSTVPSYWLVVHSRARRWAREGGRPLSRIGPLWPLLWVLMASITWRWRMVPLYHRTWSWIPGGLLIVSGLAIYWFAGQGFSWKQLLGYAELEPHRYEQKLRAGGIRARLRHPYYLGHLCELAGWSIGSGLAAAYGMTGFAILTGYFMVQAEERELEQRLGDEYRRYRQRTAAIFPGIW